MGFEFTPEFLMILSMVLVGWLTIHVSLVMLEWFPMYQVNLPGWWLKWIPYFCHIGFCGAIASGALILAGCAIFVTLFTFGFGHLVHTFNTTS